MPSFEEAVASRGEPISYMSLSGWKLRMMPTMPVRYGYTPLALTSISVCWERVEEQKRGLLGKKTEARVFGAASLPRVTKCGCTSPEESHYWLSLGAITPEIAGGGAATELTQAVRALRSLGIPVEFDSWMSEHAPELGLAAGRGASHAE
jgi:hypothetical protein